MSDVYSQLGAVPQKLPDAPADWKTPDAKADPTDDVTKKVAEAKRAEIGATEKIYGGIEKTMSQGIAHLEQLSKTAGVEAEKLKPWNEEEESAKHRTDPVMAFGSLGSVFGILASAFTHAPMANALNASASAMNAIKKGDEQEYQRAYKAWQDNTKLAMDRQKIEHEFYQDAMSLLKTNLEAGSLKLRIAAARFGDQKMLALLDAGMMKEAVDYQQAKETLRGKIEDNNNKIEMDHIKLSRYHALVKEFGGQINGDPTDEPHQKALMQWQKELAAQKAAERGGSFSLSREDAQEVSGRTAKYEAEGMTHEDAFNKARTEVAEAGKKAGIGAANLTTDRQRAQDVAAYRQKLRAEENTDGSAKWTAEDVAHKAAEYDRKLKMEAAAPTGNRRDDLQGKIDRVEHIKSIVAKVDALLLKHKAITGLGGMLTRPAEVVSNLLGGNETDRKEFQRLVETMRLEAPRILLDTQGRPISAEADRVNTMVAGLSPGDTGANAIRAYVEFREQLDQIENDLKKRLGMAATTNDTSAKTTRPSWRDAPVVH